MEKFLISVADVIGMVNNDIVFNSKSLLNTSISIGNTMEQIRGGKMNPVRAVFFHDSTFGISLEDTQFKLDYIARNTGSTVIQGGDFWTNETVVLNGKQGTITGNPIKIEGQELSVWVEVDGEFITLPLTNKNFDVSSTTIAEDSTICVKYMTSNMSAKTLRIPANIVPDKLRLYLDADLYGTSDGEGVVGHILIEIPRAQLNGTQEITMQANGYSTTPLSATALAYTEISTGCTSQQIYAKIVELSLNDNWYDGVTDLAVRGSDDFIINGLDETATLEVFAIKGNKSFPVNNAELTFVSATPATATIGEHTGVITTVATGTTKITVKITDKPDIQTICMVTVTDEE